MCDFRRINNLPVFRRRSFSIPTSSTKLVHYFFNNLQRRFGICPVFEPPFDRGSVLAYVLPVIMGLLSTYGALPSAPTARTVSGSAAPVPSASGVCFAERKFVKAPRRAAGAEPRKVRKIEERAYSTERRAKGIFYEGQTNWVQVPSSMWAP